VKILLSRSDICKKILSILLIHQIRVPSLKPKNVMLSLPK